MSEEALTVRMLSSISDLPASAWDACARAGSEFNPFVTHAFLSALEEAGCVGGRTGWTPLHLVVERSGAVVGVAPAYLKAHSMGEYVFDHAWADAIERAGGRYYPKLQVAVPFTPVPGPRLMVLPGVDASATRGALAQGMAAVVEKLGASSAHVTFLDEETWNTLADTGFLKRQDQQFHWFDRGYATFEGFLSSLASRKRKTIARERRDAVANGINIRRLTGRDITEAHWDAFFAFYTDTGSRKWGRPYLNRRFFSLLGERLADHVLLVLAYRAGRSIAGALNLMGSHALYGRHWGALEHHPFLHFEVCYYQAIEHAIEAGLQRVEAGAQGEHKLARGYVPVPTYSAHLIADPGLERAIAHYLNGERRAVVKMMAELADQAPYRHEDGAI
jgi:predicted N-acyltransferase